MIERREAEESAKLEGLRRALDEAEESVASGDLVDYSSSLLSEIDAEQSTQGHASSA